MDDDVRRLLRTVLDEPVVIRVRHDLEPAQRRLLGRLGAAYVVDADAPPCDRVCGHEECAVSVSRTERVSGMPLSMASLGTRTTVDWSPNWIDYRHSIVLVDSRRDRGDTAEICRECGCETDITPAPHSPKCPTLNGGSVDGLDLLERMDAGEPLNDEPVELEETSEPNGAGSGVSSNSSGLEEAAAVGHDAVSGAGQSLSEPERVAASSSPNGRRRGRAAKWTREKVVAAIREVAKNVGHTPTHAEMKAAGYASAGVNTTLRRIGATWPELVREAGYEPNTRASRRVARPSPAARTRNTAAARSDTDHGRARAWAPDDVLDAIRRWNAEYGHPPTSTEWMRRVDGYPTTTTVVSRFGSWANAIEQAGFDRPTRGGVPLRPLATPAKRVRVRGTGLTYKSADEAYVAAGEIEADGERVAEQARFDGNEAKAEQAIDQSRELADKIRFAAAAFEERTGGHSSGREPEAGTAAGGQAPASEPPVLPDTPAGEEPASRPDDHLLVRPEEMPPFQRAVVRGLIAGMRAAANALEQELA